MKDGSTKPIPAGDIYRHMWLTSSVAKAVGVDLGAARAEGTLAASDYSRMLTNCRNAGCDKSCALWLSQQNGPSSSAPEFCVNGALLTQLKR